ISTAFWPCGIPDLDLGGSGGMAKIRGLEAKNAPNCRGVVFYKRECTPISSFFSREIFNFFYFFLNSFIFRSIVAQFPSQFVLARPGLAPAPVQIKEDSCRIISVK